MLHMVVVRKLWNFYYRSLNFKIKAMSYFTCEGRLDFLSSEQKAQLSQRFKSPREGIMPHQLAVSVGLKYAEALAILTVLETDGFCRNQLLIYHICEPEIPAGSIPYGTGFPKLPWACPSCGEVVEDYDELSFDLMAVTTDIVEFV